MATASWAIAVVLAATAVGSLGPILLKKAAAKLERAAFTSIRALLSATIGNRSLVIGIGLYVISFVLYVFALQAADLSVLYPLVSLSYIWVSLLSMRVLHERMNAAKWTGILLIIAGATLVGFGS